MRVRAEAKNLKISAQKLRLSADLVRGNKVTTALELLAVAPQKSAAMVYDVVHSASANAQNNYNLTKSNLVIEEIHVGQGSKLKRFRPRARGSAGAIEHPTAHVTVVISDQPQPENQKAEATSKVAATKETK